MGLRDVAFGSAERGVATGAATSAVTEATVGLDTAAAKAGDVLGGIFGGVPWELDPGAIVDAVAGGVSDAAPVVIDALVSGVFA